MSALLPVGTAQIKQYKSISKGDIITLADGSTASFVELKRTKFVAMINRKSYIVPVWRDRLQTMPYITGLTGKKDTTVAVKSVKLTQFKYGDLFFIDGKKETFMFLNIAQSRKGQRVRGIDLSSKKIYTIDPGFTLVKVNLNALKKEKKIK